MKIAFSTLGCPGWKWEEIYATAKDMKLDGIEIRGIGNQISAAQSKLFSPENVNNTLRSLGSLKISLFATSVALGEDCDDEQMLKEAREHVDIAARTACGFIRVMISSKPEPTEVDYCKAVRLYDQICQYALTKGVTPLIETNGILAQSSKMLQFMEDTKNENKGILWDIHHPYRCFGETPEYTVSVLGEYIKYIHVKDSKIEDGKLKYKMMGYGDVPVESALKELKKIGYDGYVTLEWVKRWNPDLEDAGIVFSHFANYIKYLLGRI